jgi:NitT/TauT family transport system substrate-binding protein
MAGRRAGAAGWALILALVAGDARAADKISFGTNWLAQVEHGGFYQGVAEGLYAANGLDVSIKMGGPQINTAQLLIAGALDFAIVSNSFIPLNALKEGAPYVAVAGLFQKDPQVLIAHQAMGYKTLADLKGKPILISTDAWDSYWKFLKVKFAFTDDQGRSYTFNMAPFLADKTVIQQGYVTSEPLLIKAAGGDPETFLLADFGYTSYASVLMTSKKLVAEKPDLVQRFVDASIKGWYGFLHGNNDKAVAMIMKDNPDYTAKTAVDSTAALKAAGIIESGDALTLGIGAMTDARWKDFFDTMVEAKVYPANFNYKPAYTLQFVNKKVGMP